LLLSNNMYGLYMPIATSLKCLYRWARGELGDIMEFSPVKFTCRTRGGQPLESIHESQSFRSEVQNVIDKLVVPLAQSPAQS